MVGGGWLGRWWSHSRGLPSKTKKFSNKNLPKVFTQDRDPDQACLEKMTLATMSEEDGSEAGAFWSHAEASMGV